MVAHLGDYYKTDKLLARLTKLSAHKKIRAVRTESGRPLPKQKAAEGCHRQCPPAHELHNWGLVSASPQSTRY